MHMPLGPLGSVHPLGFTHRARHLGARYLGALVLAWLALFGVAHAQGFDENRYFEQCLRFEAGGDLETARLACLNALQVRPDFAAAELALGRIELALGDISSAEQRLRRVRNRIDDAEPIVLLAEAALAAGRPVDAAGLLSEARSMLAERGNRELEGRVSLLNGRIEQYRGRYSAALSAYGQAIAADALNVEYRLADAELRLRMSDPASASQQLESYMQLTGDERNAQVRSLLGRAAWAQGDLETAAAHLEFAHQLRGARDVDAQARDLRALAMIYTAQGDLEAGGLALRESVRRENLLSYLSGNTLLWLLALLLLVAVHLVGESRIASSSSLEVVDGPRAWSVGQAYGVLLASLLVALAITLVYGQVRYDNLLVLLTPVLQSDARALFLLTTSVLLALLTWRRVQMNGFEPLEALMGRSDRAGTGFVWGVLFLAATLAYLHYRPFDGSLGVFYLDLFQLTPFVVAAAILVPLTELFFRAFLLPPLTRRYDAAIATIVSAALYALVFSTPVALLAAFGLLLADAFRRRKSGWEPLVAQLTLHVGLLIAVSASPWARSLFYG